MESSRVIMFGADPANHGKLAEKMANDADRIISVKIVNDEIKTKNDEGKSKLTFSNIVSVVALCVALATALIGYFQVRAAKEANTVAEQTQLSSLVGEIASEPLALAQTASADANNPADLHTADVAITIGRLVQAQEAYGIMQSLDFNNISATESYEVAEGYSYGGDQKGADFIFKRALREHPDTRTKGDILIGLAVSYYNAGGLAADTKAQKYMQEARDNYRNASASANHRNEVYVALTDIPFEAQLPRPDCITVQNELNQALGIIPSQNSAQLEDEDEPALLQPALEAAHHFCPHVLVPNTVRIGGVTVRLTDTHT
jgi:tetratricopeptide (TPR) repeat protein